MDLATLSQDLPEEAYLFFPTGDDVKIGEEKKILRRIFEGTTTYDEFENKQVLGFHEYLGKKNITLPDWKFPDTLRFLIANHFNYDHTLKTILEYIEWKKANLPVKLTPAMTTYLNSGILYVHGRDNRFRPIIVMNSYMINPKTLDLDGFLGMCTYYLEYLMNNLMLPGQIENWIIFNDLNNMGLLSLPMDTMKKVMKYFQNNYRGRLFKMYILNAPTSIAMGWSLIKGLLEDTTVKKIQFEKSNTTDDMWKHINKDQVEIKYGGNARDSKEKFWPPIFPSNSYFTVADKKDKILETKENYCLRYKQGKLQGHKISSKLLNSAEKKDFNGKNEVVDMEALD